MQEFHLLTNITVALFAAFLGGIVARRLRMPTIVGYLVAGIAIGPFTPGFVGDVDAILELAEIGIVFLMFGVGLHFSLRDLWVVRDIALPGAVIQMALATLLGVGLTQLWGWSLQASLILGLAISIASTVVLLRGLEDHGLLNTIHGRVAVGWLIVEDIATVIILVVLRAFGEGQGSLLETGIFTLMKAGIFVALMLLVGARFVPWLFSRMAFTESRELFILTVVVVALGTALGTFVKTEGQSSNLSIMLGMAMALLGGCWWPMELFPTGMQKVVKVLPTTWAMSAMTDITMRGHGLADILPEAGVLLAFAAVFFVVGLWRFRYE